MEFGSYEEIHKNLSKKFRAELRYKRNRIARQDKVGFLSIRTKKDLNCAFQDFIDIEGGGWKGEEGTAIKQDQKTTKFYKNLIDNLSKDNRCEINLLKVNDKSIAALLCGLTDETLYAMKLGYDEKYSTVSPGVLLLDSVIKKYSNNDSIKNINLMSDHKLGSKYKPLSMGCF